METNIVMYVTSAVRQLTSMVRMSRESTQDVAEFGEKSLIGLGVHSVRTLSRDYRLNKLLSPARLAVRWWCSNDFLNHG